MTPSKWNLFAAVLPAALVFTLVAPTPAMASKSCTELTEDLRAMQRAQSSLLETMVRKNDSMADTLDQYAANFQNKKTLRKTDLVSLKKSAQAFRNHHEREEKLVQRFESKTSELISMVEDCLRSKTIASQ